MKIKIRKANSKDSKDIIRLIIELAKFEKLLPPDEKAKQRLFIHAFGKNPSFYVLLAKTNGTAVGYAFYFFTYSSFLARRTLYLEDIFVSENYRNKGIGKLLFNELVNIAKKQKCGRMEWCVLEWNINAINFYEKLGARQLKEWNYYRLDLK
jgi:GNAT superfamily N-acetyltransferase